MEYKNECYEILLTYVCNARCKFCSQGDFDKSKDAPFEQIVKEIYLAKKMGFHKIGFSGGEPTTRKELIEFIKIAYKVGFRFIRIQTNGIKISNYTYATHLKDAGLTFCKFSFVSDKPEIHNYLFSIPNAWEMAIKGVENMVRLKVRVGTNILINRYNYNTLDRMIKTLMDRGITNFVMIYPLYEGSMYKNKEELKVSLPECREYFLRSIELMKKNKMDEEIIFLNVPPCFLEKDWEKSVGVSPFNTVVTSPYGDTTNLDEVSDVNKVKGEICNECDIRDRCKGANRTYIEIFGWEGFRPIKTVKKKKSFYLTDNEKCLIEVLKIKNNIDTETVMEIAKKIPLCYDCNDGNNIINAAAKLVNKKIIKMEFKKGKYYFRLLRF